MERTRKEELEYLLPAKVCNGEIDLSTAQRDISYDWLSAQNLKVTTCVL